MSAAYENLPVYQSALKLAAYFELIVRNFERYHKYRIGTDLRMLAQDTLVIIAEANTRSDREVKIKEALKKLFRLKILVQLCAEMGLFNRNNNFPTAIKMVVNISKQCEGWLKKCQNPGGSNPSGSERM